MNKSIQPKLNGIKITCFILFLFFSVQLSSTVQAKNGGEIWRITTPPSSCQTQKKVTLNYKRVPLKTVLNSIEKQSGFGFAISESVEQAFREVTIITNSIDVDEALQILLKESDYKHRVVNDIIVIEKRNDKNISQQEKITISGIVTEHDKKTPVIGATVLISGTSIGTATDKNGKFTISAEKGQTLIISFIGMVPVEIRVDGAGDDLKIVLENEIVDVDEVVVTGYYSRKASSYTGNAIKYTGEDLRQISSSNVLSSLSMIEPSFKLIISNEYGSDPNRIPDIQIQGATNLQNEYSNTPNMPTFILDGFEVTPQKIFDLDPNRVKSITVLKDASATAIYGSRAANGVVVIETITPQEGKLKFNYSFNGDFEIADLSSYNLMNAEEKLRYEVAAGLFIQSNGYPPAQESLDIKYNNKLKLVEQGINTDWIKKPVRSIGFNNKHTLSIEGGSESFRYSLNLNYRAQEGIMKGSGRNNMGIGINIQYLHKNLRFSNDLTFTNTKQFNSPYGTFSEYAEMNPYYYPYDSNGNVIYQVYKTTASNETNIYNPMFNATINTKDESIINNITEQFSIEYEMVKGLKLKTNFSLDKSFMESDNFKPNRHTSFANATEYKGSYLKTNSTNTTYAATASAIYFLGIDDHALNLAAIYNIRESKTNTYSVTAYNFPNDNFDHIGMGIQYKEGDQPGGTMDISRLMGVAFNANYSYDNRYLLDFSLRSDASSVFGSNKRWGTFYSIGAGWNIHNEKFLKEINFINNLKLRSSYGTTGGQNFYPYQAMMMYSYKIMGGTYDGEVGALAMAYGNKDLKWQITKKTNIGLDFSFLNQHISGYINRYSNLTEGKLIDFTLAPSTGFSTYTVNLGKVKNEGWEMSIKGTVFNKRSNNLRWDLFINAISNKNKLTDINDALTAFNDKQNENLVNEGLNKPVVKYMEGHSINTLWANESLGIDPATGDEVFLDLNGNKTNLYDVNNDKPIKASDPKFEGNFGTMITLKNWTLNAYFAYSYGGYIYNQTLVNKIENVNPQNNGDKRILYDRWQKPGDVAKFKRINNREITYPTSRFIEKENFVRLSSLNLSYQFNSQKIKDLGIEVLKITAIGNDIFRASTVKMERGVSYPFARTFSLNVQLIF